MGRSVLVTGGNRGIGLAIVRTLAEAGDAVTATYRSGEPPADAPDGVTWVRADVTDTASVEAAFKAAEEANGPVEVAVANAGMTKDQLVMRMPDEDFASVIDTNLAGAFRVARRAANGMLRLKRGRIVLVGSVVALSGSAGQVNYAASKAGLVGLARSLAREVGSRGITVNVVAPGFTQTDMTAGLSEARRSELLASVPLRRLASPEEVAGAVRFLAGPDAAYVTGAVLPVDGGLGMGH